jgi:hypothetical protein
VVGLVAPLYPQVGGIASFAEWLLTHQEELGCRLEPFDLTRDPADEMGGRLRLSSVPRQARLLGRFVGWLLRSPRVVHYCVSWSHTGLTRDVVFMALLRLRGRHAIAHIHVNAEPRGYRRTLARVLARVATVRVTISPWSEAALARAGISAPYIFNPVTLEPASEPPPVGRRARRCSSMRSRRRSRAAPTPRSSSPARRTAAATRSGCAG